MSIENMDIRGASHDGIESILKSHAPLTRRGVFDAFKLHHPQAYQHFSTSQALNEISKKLDYLRTRNRAAQVGTDSESGAILWTHPDNVHTPSSEPKAPNGDPLSTAVTGARPLVCEERYFELVDEELSTPTQDARAPAPAEAYGDDIAESADAAQQKRLADAIIVENLVPEGTPSRLSEAFSQLIETVLEELGPDTENFALENKHATLEALDVATQLIDILQPERAELLKRLADQLHYVPEAA